VQLFTPSSAANLPLVKNCTSAGGGLGIAIVPCGPVTDTRRQPVPASVSAVVPPAGVDARFAVQSDAPTAIATTTAAAASAAYNCVRRG
jgi:hypothetical protein